MAAPHGNKFWEARSSHGRNPKFETAEQLWSSCLEYFEWVESHPLWEIKVFHSNGLITEAQVPKMRAMTIDGLCIFLDITDQTLYNYKERGDDFLDIVTRAEKIIRTQKFQGAAADFLNPNIIARDLGLKESSQHEHSGPGGEPIRTVERVIVRTEKKDS